MEISPELIENIPIMTSQCFATFLSYKNSKMYIHSGINQLSVPSYWENLKKLLLLLEILENETRKLRYSEITLDKYYVTDYKASSNMEVYKASSNMEVCCQRSL